MQKIGILNSKIAKVLADMGHTDQITIGDCGLPIPQGVPRIDLALRLGQPGFMDVTSEVAKYMEIQKIYVAPEMAVENPEQWKKLHELFPEDQVEWVVLSSHEELKQMTKNSKAVIRTGEITPFSNVVLESGVIF
jgi:D-ribose pyranase